jgi:CheY-like chemotaxis protein
MAATDRKGEGCRVLVVDDNLDNAESLSMFVRLLGHEVETAHDGLQAIEVAQRFAPDLVLLDIGLPKLDGYEVAQRLRADATCKAACLVAITGWGRDEDNDRAMQAGFDHHLTKPVDPAVLEKLIAEMCAAR